MRFLWTAYAAIALLAGVGLPLQAAINVRLRDIVGNPVRASLVSFLVGSVLLAVATLAIREPLPSLGALARAPWWVWTGGVLGTAYIVATIVLVPRLGSAYTFALVVAGQMAMSVAIDRFGLFGTTAIAFSPARAFGAALLVGGVLLMRR
ncbi:MAG: DMT family transporter [Vulcanimicrobiaceae bacterium]